jgi:hypothetical protein
VKTIKYFDKSLLKTINYFSSKILQYNRTLSPAFIDTLPDDKLFPVVFTLLHEHKAGQPCDPHMRCMIAVQDLAGNFHRVMLDVEMRLYERLPTAEVPDTPTEPADAVAGS